MNGSDSFQELLNDLERGGQEGMEAVIEKFRHRLAGLIRKERRDGRGDIFDTDDMLQSVFVTFWRRWREGRASHWSLDGWDDLWRLLAEITRRRCIRYHRRAHRAKRDIDRQVRIDEDSRPMDLPTADFGPEEMAAFGEALEQLLAQLNEEARLGVLRRLEGASKEQIAGEMQRSLRTVNRRLERAEKILEKLLQEAGDDDDGR